jgi:crossover junction endodeoxyribonuclease RuvC
MLILGIDPGLNTTGYGLVEAAPSGLVVKGAGYVKTRLEDGMPRRLADIHQGLKKVIERFKPQAIVLEKLYAHYKHPVTASLLGHARGVICMLADEHDLDFYEYAATRVKKTVTGSGHASKLQVQRMIEQATGTPHATLGPVDTTDAIALAMTHAYLMRTHTKR